MSYGFKETDKSAKETSWSVKSEVENVVPSYYCCLFLLMQFLNVFDGQIIVITINTKGNNDKETKKKKEKKKTYEDVERFCSG